MASPANRIDGETSPTVPSSSLPAIPLILTLVAAVLLTVLLLSGGTYYLIKSGRLSLPITAAPLAPARVPSAEDKTHPMAIEPLVVNLADPGGKAYLRLGMTLRVFEPEVKQEEKTDPKQVKSSNEAEAAVRDTALQVLGHATAEMLLAPDGKEQLKHDLKTAFAQHNHDIKIADVYFTEFLVQR